MRIPTPFAAFAFALLAASPLAQADAEFRTIDTEILDIRRPQGSVTVYSILSTRDGRVYTVDPAIPGNGALVAKIERLAAEGQRRPVHLTLQVEGEDDEVVSITELSAAEARDYRDDLSQVPTEALNAEIEGPTMQVDGYRSQGQVPAAIAEARTLGFEPTVLRSMKQAERLFKEQVPMEHDTQCHQRAMRWSFDAWRTHKINSMKVMMFFTRQFQTTFVRVSRLDRWVLKPSVKPYKWWYHTAPYVFVGDQEIVLDSEFLPGPVTMDQWSHYFLSEIIEQSTNVLKESGLRRDSYDRLVDKDQKPVTWTYDGKKRYVRLVDRLSEEQTRCRVISNYRQFNEDQKPGEWCMVRKLPMYYYMPWSFQSNDCDPRIDPAPGRSDTRLNDGRLKYPCFKQARRGWNDEAVKYDLKNMKKADTRE